MARSVGRPFFVAALLIGATLLMGGRAPRSREHASPYVYVTDYTAGSVKLYNYVTRKFIRDFVPAGSGGLAYAHDLVFAPDGYLYVCCGTPANSVKRYDAHSGAYQGDAVPSNCGGLDNPVGLLASPDGSLLVSSTLTSEIKRYSISRNNGATTRLLKRLLHQGSTGASTPYLGNLDTHCGPSEPVFMAYGPDSLLYVVSNLGAGTATVSRFDITTGKYVDAFVRGSNRFSSPMGIAFGPDGNLYVAMFGSGVVARFRGSTGAYIDEFVKQGAGGMSGPEGIAFGPDGLLYVASSAGVQRYNDKTGKYVDSLDPLNAGGLQFAYAIAFH